MLGEATKLAEAFGEELHVVHVAGQYESTEQIRRSSQAHLGEAIDTNKPQKQAETRAEQLASSIVEEFTPVGRIGYPAQEITEYSDEQAARYIVIGGRKQSPVGRFYSGASHRQYYLKPTSPSFQFDFQNQITEYKPSLPVISVSY